MLQNVLGNWLFLSEKHKVPVIRFASIAARCHRNELDRIDYLLKLYQHFWFRLNPVIQNRELSLAQQIRNHKQNVQLRKFEPVVTNKHVIHCTNTITGED